LICFVGENGVGKTSLMEHLFINNQSLVSMIQQSSLNFFYDRQLYQIKDIFLKSQLKSVSLTRFEDYWKLFKLHEKENRLLSSLSGGESQSLKLCLGLSFLKDVYFLDEPSQFLDDFSKSKLSTLLKNLLDDSKSIVMIEHDLNWLKLPSIICPLEIKNNILSKGISWSI
jgi:energy-coupling factor transporter ATP-binding protein EcfA2